MATSKSVPAPVVDLSIAENAGIVVAEALDAELGIVRGYRAARVPELRQARQAHNERRRTAITAKLLADLES